MFPNNEYHNGFLVCFSVEGKLEKTKSIRVKQTVCMSFHLFGCPNIIFLKLAKNNYY